MDLFDQSMNNLEYGSNDNENGSEFGKGAELAARDGDQNLDPTPVGTMRADHGGAPSKGSIRGPAPAEKVDTVGALVGASIAKPAGEQTGDLFTRASKPSPK